MNQLDRAMKTLADYEKDWGIKPNMLFVTPEIFEGLRKELNIEFATKANFVGCPDLMTINAAEVYSYEMLMPGNMVATFIDKEKEKNRYFLKGVVFE